MLALLILFAIMLGAGAAGTPVNGDRSVAATTAGINLGPAVNQPPRVQAVAIASLFDTRLVRLLILLLVAAAVVLVEVVDTRDASLLRAEWHAQRGPPVARGV